MEFVNLHTYWAYGTFKGFNRLCHYRATGYWSRYTLITGLFTMFSFQDINSGIASNWALTWERISTATTNILKACRQTASIFSNSENKLAQANLLLTSVQTSPQMKFPSFSGHLTLTKSHDPDKVTWYNSSHMTLPQSHGTTRPCPLHWPVIDMWA